MSDEREDLESRLRRELDELAHNAPGRDDTRAAARDPRRGRALLAAAAIVVVIAIIAALAASHNDTSTPAVSRIARARFALAPVDGQSKPPCHSAQVLDPGGAQCITLGTTIATNSNVTVAVVVYDAVSRSWTVELTLDAATEARIARLLGAKQGTLLGFIQFAALVDDRIVDIGPLLSGQDLLLGRAGQTRVQAIALATSITGRAPKVQGGPNDTELTLQDHWHVALGVDDCGTWVPNWGWPPGNTAQGVPARAGSGGRLYAGLHSHGDGLIHLEAATNDETGAHATLGLYFRYGGWKLTERALTFVGVDEKNGNPCDGKPGVLRWSVNGVEQHGDPTDYRLLDGDVIELVFTTADAPMPPKTEVPSYRNLQDVLGQTNP